MTHYGMQGHPGETVLPGKRHGHRCGSVKNWGRLSRFKDTRTRQLPFHICTCLILPAIGKPHMFCRGCLYPYPGEQKLVVNTEGYSVCERFPRSAGYVPLSRGAQGCPGKIFLHV
jgi:hypothetical protein